MPPDHRRNRRDPGLAGLLIPILAAVAPSPVSAQYLETQLSSNGGLFTTSLESHLADFDLDGIRDLALLDVGRILLYRSPGLGGSSQLGTPTAVIAGGGLPAGMSPISFRAGHVNGDPAPDLLIITGNFYTPPQYAWFCLMGTGDGTFAAPLSMTPAPGASSWIETLDLDGDGRVDYAIHGSSGNPPAYTFEIRLNRFPAWISVLNQVPPVLTTSTGVADLDGDGRDEYVWTTQGGGMSILWGPSGAVAASPTSMMLPPASPTILGTGDFDGDGCGDVILRSATGVPCRVLYGASSGVLPAPVPFPGLLLPAPASLDSVAACDVDADGVPDVLIGSSAPHPAGPAVTASFFHVLRGRGNRNFDPVPRLLWNSPAGAPSIFRTHPADLDRDGDSDLIAVNAAVPNITIIRNNARRGAPCLGSAGEPGFPIGAAFLGNAAFFLGLEGAAPGRAAGVFLSVGTAPLVYCSPGLGLAPALLILPLGNLGIGTTDAAGRAAVPLPIPPAPALAGMVFSAQWAIDDPGGLYTTGGRTYALTTTRTIIPW